MADETKENTVKIAVLASEVNGLREQHKAQAQEMLKRLDEHSRDAKDASAVLLTKIDPVVQWIQQNHEIPDKVTVLWDTHNSQKGIFKASSFIAGICGAIFVFVADKVIK